MVPDEPGRPAGPAWLAGPAAGPSKASWEQGGHHSTHPRTAGNADCRSLGGRPERGRERASGAHRARALSWLEWGGAARARPRDENFLREGRGRLGRSVLRTYLLIEIKFLKIIINFLLPQSGGGKKEKFQKYFSESLLQPQPARQLLSF